MPKSGYKCVMEGGKYPAWPLDWMDRGLKRIRNGRGDWLGTVSSDGIQFSFSLTKGKQVPAKMRPHVEAAVLRLQSQQRADALNQSDNEDPVG